MDFLKCLPFLKVLELFNHRRQFGVLQLVNLVCAQELPIQFGHQLYAVELDGRLKFLLFDLFSVEVLQQTFDRQPS